MRWQGRRQSHQVEDRRGRGGLPFGRGATVGCGGLLVVIALALLTGQDPARLLEVLGGATTSVDAPGGAPSPTDGGPDPLREFVAVVLADTEDTWQQLFRQRGLSYDLPALVLFSDAVPSACGFNSSAVGPFYCPADRKVYLDLSFFDALDRRFGAPGDFAQAYVIAHEVGHHVQNLLGISTEVRRRQSRVNEAEANALSVRLELQADCLAGVWGYHAHHRRQFLEPGDTEEGLRAAAAIGDDRLGHGPAGAVHPESWTHGSSEQRSRWLRRGLESGDPEACDTLAAARL
jgi:hypothetical protein